jgi:putative GTP pyrophosphokinase
MGGRLALLEVPSFACRGSVCKAPVEDPVTGEEKGFDFKQHEHAAVVAYLERRSFYEELAAVVRRIVEEALKRRAIKVHSVQSRAKDAASFGKKSAEPSEADPARPKYDRPLEQITDLAGVRVITYFPSTLAEIDEVFK